MSRAVSCRWRKEAANISSAKFDHPCIYLLLTRLPKLSERHVDLPLEGPLLCRNFVPNAENTTLVSNFCALDAACRFDPSFSILTLLVQPVHLPGRLFYRRSSKLKCFDDRRTSIPPPPIASAGVFIRSGVFFHPQFDLDFASSLSMRLVPKKSAFPSYPDDICDIGTRIVPGN